MCHRTIFGKTIHLPKRTWFFFSLRPAVRIDLGPSSLSGFQRFDILITKNIVFEIK